MRTIFQNIWQEICNISKSPSLIAFFWIAPVALSIFVYAIFSKSNTTDIAIALIDKDKSDISRNLARSIDASPAIRIRSNHASLPHAKSLMQKGDIFGILFIPKGFAKGILTANPPQITLFYNGQYMGIGNSVKNAISKVSSTHKVQYDAYKKLTENISTQNILALSAPVSFVYKALYNQNLDYAKFLITGAVPTLWQVLIILGMLVSLSRSHPNGKPATIKQIAAKSIAHYTIFFIHSILFWATYAQKFPLLIWQYIAMSGTLFLMCLAVQSLAVIVYYATQDYRRSISVCAGFTAPAFAFVGITFPTESMPVAAQIWRNFLPISHYLDIQNAVVFKNALTKNTGLSVIYLCIFISIGVLYYMKKSHSVKKG